MIHEVTKKDGRIEVYHRSKLEKSIKAAIVSAYGESHRDGFYLDSNAGFIACRVESELIGHNKVLSDDIFSLVINALNDDELFYYAALDYEDYPSERIY